MDDIIHLLPDTVANQIAAGEVVQRPSSIVKEMVENSIDAGAGNIKVLVADGGKTHVQVVDDGKGMSETDARLSFERHATSKIRQASDLFQLATMGFRGEALASIAAVAQVELKTRRVNDELGTMIRLSGSKLDAQEPVACPVGSNFSVRNLFFNVPARRKFLKSSQTELNNVVADFQRIVLTHPDISFSLHNNGAEMYHLPQSSLKQRILDVFGKKMNADLLPIEVETSLVSLSGYVGKPEAARKRGAQQFFFVNGRYMRHPYFHSAVMRAYDNMIPVGENVPYFIYLSVDPASIDVNVHPTKTEIKFDNEQDIWQILMATVKEALGRFCNVPLIDFDVEDKPDIPVMGTGGTPVQPRLAPVSYNPFDTHASRTSAPSAGWEKLYTKIQSSAFNSMGRDEQFPDGSLDFPLADKDVFADGGGDGQPVEAPFAQSLIWKAQNADFEGEAVFDASVPKFQYKGQYIVLPSSTGIMVVNQHRAHVRVLFERHMSCIATRNRPTQRQLFLRTVQFDPEEAAVLDDLADDMASLGFDLSNLGGGTYSVNGIPAGVEGMDVDTLLHEMVAAAKDKTSNLRREAQEALALSMAEQSAIVYGQILSSLEMEHLLQELFSTPSPMRTPDGKVICAIVSDTFLRDCF